MVLLTVATAAAGAVFLYFVDPAGAGFLAPCPFHALTGLHCPGCGSLRALHAIAHGDFAAAVGLNPLMVVMLPYVAYALVSQGLVVFGRRPLPGVFSSAFSIWVLLGAIIAYGVLRNVPVYPFTVLAP